MATKTDDIIDAIVVSAQVETGMPRGRALARARSASGQRAAAAVRQEKPYNARWTPDEDEFLRRNLGRLSEDEIARRLGRSVVGIHLHWKRDLRLPAPTKMPGEISTNQIAEGLGLDAKSVHRLFDRNLLRGRCAPVRNVIRLVEKQYLLAWLVDPKNWIYFDPVRVGVYGPRRTVAKYDRDFWAEARRRVVQARARWNDEWLTPGQVALYYKVDHRLVNDAIRSGKLKAVRFGNWRIRKSEVVRQERQFFAGRPGSLHVTRSDARLILGQAIGAYASWPTDRSAGRLREIRQQHRIRGIIRQYGLRIQYSRRGLFADWKVYRPQFPTVARAMEKFKRGQPLAAREAIIVHSVLTAWAKRFYFEHDRKTFLQWLHNRRYDSHQAEQLRTAYARLKKSGIDPYQRARA